LLRGGVYVKMTQEGLKRGVDTVKKDKIQRQYNEVADEVQNLQNIICSVAEFKEKDEETKKNIDSTFKDKEYGYAEKNTKSPWWWPLLINVDDIGQEKGVDDYNNLSSIY
jgi:hypothetical protein